MTQLILGRIHLDRREFDAGERRLEIALELNQSDADALAQVALGMTYLGRPAEAQRCAEQFRAEFRQKILFGREPERPLDWER